MPKRRSIKKSRKHKKYNKLKFGTYDEDYYQSLPYAPGYDEIPRRRRSSPRNWSDSAIEQRLERLKEPIYESLNSRKYKELASLIVEQNRLTKEVGRLENKILKIAECIYNNTC